MIIKFEPYGFVVFLTVAMGMVYAVLNSRSGWGFWKLAMVGIFVFPFLWYGFMLGRVVEVVAGSLIGHVYARGGFSLPNLNPFSGIVYYFRARKAARVVKASMKKAERERAKQEREQAKAEKKAKRQNSKKNQQSSTTKEDEAQKRREQAKAERERANAKKQQHKKAHSESAKKNTNRPPKEPEKPVDNRTPYEILGISPGANQAQTKKAYAILRSRFHPDKYEHMSEEFRKEAEEELKKVNRAWTHLRNSAPY